MFVFISFCPVIKTGLFISTARARGWCVSVEMKKKRAEKRGHVVAWLNKAEWEQVVDYLHSREPALQTHALHRITAWKGR